MAKANPKRVVFIGQQVDRWTVIGPAEKIAKINKKGKVHHRTYYLCRCICGTVRYVNDFGLFRRPTAGCGCSRGESHGLARSPEYNIWGHMIRRCTNPKDHKYPIYGGRGIKVCERWRNSFTAFLTDMGKRPSPQHSIDRYPNNDGDYEPGNCRWATRKEQGSNMRVTIKLTLDGVTLSLAEWAKQYGISRDLVYSRLYIQKPSWELRAALTTPANGRPVPTGAAHGQYGQQRPNSWGEKNVNARLTPELVIQIRADVQNGATIRGTARRLGVSQRTIQGVVRRETWKHI
jgi:hypothetical protein